MKAFQITVGIITALGALIVIGYTLRAAFTAKETDNNKPALNGAA